MQTSNIIVNKYGKKFFSKIETKYFNKAKLNPVCEFDIFVTAFYRSPQGRNFYEKTIRCPYGNIIYFWKIAKNEEQHKRSMDYQIKLERLKMSDSLRFEILKKDNYRCCICGRSSKEDGVKLEIDHIIPVSKGGKTEVSNLQTLCEQCNRGKSNKLMYNNLSK